MRLVMKKVQCKEDNAEQTMRSYTSEKVCARTMHFAIVPLLGIREDPKKREFYFLSPYMDNGNLNSAIEKDSKLVSKHLQPILNVRHRLRIMFQIASAIDFLHTPVPDIRGLILHMDIKSLNIVLDQNLNARIIDFGLAREMKHGHDHTSTTSLHYYATPGYDKLTQQQILGKHDDYRYFGVVMRELLTGRKPSIEGCPEATLKDQSVTKIKRASMKMWKDLVADPPVTDRLVELSVKCITNKDITSKTLVTELKQLLADTNTKRWARKNESSRCDMCLEYEAGNDLKNVLICLC
ncbi:uncharacterized protein LOC123534596 [Mercenaria mercenaria]|uniref:uncharacterized protein LOC123534596 n=1 Tax=Mercenaria mercenaria TaxID=6596 RepID=UPI00234F2FFE|nr:uncharacterized protein LOC123534596 [Mercenaria mercenaria]